jgi:DNA-directed RNA polymerase alpha subunit
MQEDYFIKNDPGFQQSLTNLNLNECKELRRWVNRRIKYLTNIPHPEKKIKDLNLSVRAYNALLNNDLITIADVLRYGIHKLANLKNVGIKTANEIKLAVERKSS